MSLFKKKEKKTKEELEFEKKAINKSSYWISLYEVFGDVPRQIDRFKTTRVVDQDSRIPFLENKEKNFFEIFPHKVQDFIGYNEKDVDKKIHKYSTLLKEERQKKDSNINVKDIEYELMRFRAIKRTFKFSRNSSYISLASDNIPEILYMRQGTEFIPYKWDNETNTIYAPSDNKKKSAVIALRNKDNKYPTGSRNIKIMTWVFFIVALLFCGGTGWMFYKTNMAYSDSEINNVKEACLQDVAYISQEIRENSKSISNMLDSVEDKVVVQYPTSKQDTQQKQEFEDGN